MRQSAIQIDWLTINMLGDFYASQSFEFKKMDYGCRMFRNIIEVSDEKGLLGVLTNCPTSSVLNERFAQFKINNRVLYSETCFDRVQRFARMCHFDITGVSRIDLCCDFQPEDGDMNPIDLIKGFVTGVYEPLTKCQFSISGKFGKCSDLQYIRIGSRHSAVQARMYNKTVEMQEVHDKHYIRDVWKQYGFDENQTVWRLEFQIGSDFHAVVDKDTAELIELNYNSIQSAVTRFNLFGALQYRFFRFKVPSRDRNKTRWEDVMILPSMAFRTIAYSEVQTPDTKRSDRIFAARMAQYLQQDVHGSYFVRGGSYEGFMQWVHEHRLTPYLIKRGIYVEAPKFEEDILL